MTPKKKTNNKAKKKAIKKMAGKFMGHDIFIDEAMNVDEIMFGYDWGRTTNTHMKQGPGQSLNSEDIQRAIEMLRVNDFRQHGGDQFQTLVESMLLRGRGSGADVEDLMHVMIALIQAFNIQVRKHPSAAFGDQIIISAHFPLGEHTQQFNIACKVSDRRSPESQMDKHYTLVKSMQELMKPMRDWIHIAEHAKKDMDFKEILAIENMEQRRAALRIFGEERLLEEAHARLLDTGTHGQELYVIPEDTGAFDTDAFFLKYNCPSTGRLYISGVDPSLFIQTRQRWRPDNWPTDPRHLRQGSWLGKDHQGWADKAMAWKFHMTPEEYAAVPSNNQA